MMNRYIVIEYNRVTPIAFHIIRSDATPLEEYNQTRSITTFARIAQGDIGRMNHWFKVEDFDYYFKWREQQESRLQHQLPSVDIASTLKSIEDHYSVFCIFHDDLWDFYQSVGYDYSKKKFI